MGRFVFGLLVLLIAFCNNVSVAIAGQKDSIAIDDLVGMEIEDLLQVYVASKRNESTHEAPSVINVITADDIRKFGANDLADVLRRLPGVYEASGSGAPGTNFNLRGQSSSNVNKHLLLLLNGRPMRDPAHAGWNVAIYQSFPIEAIKRIEFVRGPGSVLCGSGAFAGVLNIVTKGAFRGSGGSLSFVGGTNKTSFVEGSAGINAKGVKIYAAGKKGQTDFVEGVRDRAGTLSTKSDDFKKQSESIVARMIYGGFEFNAFRGHTINSDPQFPFVYPMVKADNTRTVADLGYRHHLNDHWVASANYTYSSLYSSRGPTSNRADSYGYLGEANISGSMLEGRLNSLLGATYERFKYNNLSNRGYETTKSLYGQLDYQVFDWVKFIAGMQLNDPGNSKHYPSHRLGAITNFNKNWGMKLLYSEAFRSPSLAESTVTGALINRATDLGPEEIGTYDAQIFYRDEKLDAAFTYFQSKQTGSIRFLEDPDDPGRFRYQNFGKSNYEGFELEGRYDVSLDWELEGSVSLQRNSQNGINDTQLVPNYQAKLGAVYSGYDGVRVGMFNTYTSDPTNTEEIRPTVPVVNPSSGPRNYLTANIDISLNEFFELPANAPQTSFSIYGSDLLESGTFYVPDINNGVNTFPIGPGRSIYGRLRLKF